MKYFFLFLTGVFCLFNEAASQLPENLSQYKSAMINDEQLKKYLDQADANGLSIEQMEQELKKRGLPDQEIALLKARIQQLNGGIKAFKPKGAATVVSDSLDMRTRKDKPITDTLVLNEPEPLISRVFGSELFNGKTLTFEPDLRLATPSNYKVGPDDQLLLDISGINESQQKLTVNPDGYVRIKYVGPVFVSGLTIEEARNRIVNSLSKIYPNIKSGGSKVILSLGAIRSIKVSIIGAIKKPGTYTLSSLATLFNALYVSGGPDDFGSMREIELLRNNKIIQKVDIYKFLLKGDLSQNLRLMDNDVIRVPIAGIRVNVAGEIKRSGIFEIFPTDNLHTLIYDLCGGFQRSAYTALIKAERITEREKMLVDIPKASFESFFPKDGDTYTIDKVLDRYENVVTLTGAVYRSGKFSFTQGMRLSDLIKKGDGLREDAYREKAILYRKRDNETKEIISININKIFTDTSADLLLRKDDELAVNTYLDLNDEYVMTIIGAVRFPGIFIYRDNTYLKDAILMARGLRDDAYLGRAIITRVNRSDNSNYSISVSLDSIITGKAKDILIEKKDIIEVLSQSDLKYISNVSILGEVKKPGSLPFASGLTLKSLVLSAGGFTEVASLTNIEIARRRKLVNPNDEKAAISDVIQINIDSSDLSNSLNDVTIEPYDIVTVKANPFKKEQEIVSIAGEVMYPGPYALKNRQERVSDIIKRAGGFKAEANIEGAKLQRLKTNQMIEAEKIERLSKQAKDSTGLLFQNAVATTVDIALDVNAAINRPGSESDVVLQMGDVLIIPKKDDMVEVLGEVLHPVKIAYKRRSLRYYINSSGGFVSSAQKNKTFVVYQNGKAARTKKSFFFFRNYPKVLPGSQVYVPKFEKEEKPKKSAAEIMAISSAVATFAYLIIFISQQIK